MQYVKDMLATGLSTRRNDRFIDRGILGGGGDDEESAWRRRRKKKSGGIFVGLDSPLEKLAGLVAGGVVYVAPKALPIA